MDPTESNPYNITIPPANTTKNDDPIISPIIDTPTTTIIKTNKTSSGSGDSFDSKEDTAS